VVTEAAGRAAVASRSQGRCEVCGIRLATTWSHRKRRGQGGTWSPANGLHSCGDGTTGCEGAITAHRDPLTGEPADVFALGLQVRSGDDPANVPVRLVHPVYGAGWWWLNEDGTMSWASVGDMAWQPPRRGEQLATYKHARVVRTVQP